MTTANASLEAQAVRHLTKLSAEIGPRPIGSRGNLAAAAYIHDVFADAGLQVSELRFDWPDWTAGETRLEVDGVALAAAANPFSPACEISAPTVPISTLAELEAASLQGKIGVMVGDLAREALLPKGYTVYTSERSQRIVSLLETRQPAALLTLSARFGETDPVIADADLGIPSASIPPEAALHLIQHNGQPAHLRIAAQRAPSHSATIIGCKPGSNLDRIVLCAHYDTKFGTPGAWDNASGVAALLTLAGLLAKRDLGVGLEFIAFTDEEYAGHDDGEYVVHRGDQMTGILAAINMDGIGQWLASTSIMIASHSEAFQAQVEAIVKRYPGVVWVDPWPASNHSTFAWRGVPSLALSSSGGTPLTHTAADTIEWINPARLGEVVALVAEIVEWLRGKSLAWTRPG